MSKNIKTWAVFLVCFLNAIGDVLCLSVAKTSETNDIVNQTYSRCIHRFDYTLLPILYPSSYDEPKYEYPGHGGVTLMYNSTWVTGPSKIETIKTRFDILTRDRHILGIEFDHRQRGESELDENLCNKVLDVFPFDFKILRESNFDPAKRTVIVIPGYKTGDYVEWMHPLNRTWLALEDINLIFVTWSSANTYRYETTLSNLPFVARQITILLHYLCEINQVDLIDSRILSKIHILGHSMGAHIAGLVGRDFGGTLGRISGFDPAGPDFEDFNYFYRIDRYHARLVDIYHSNMGRFSTVAFLCSLYYDNYGYYLKSACAGASNVGINADPNLPGSWFGIDKNVGHIDYYLNNGAKQLGCHDHAHVCDHSRAAMIIGNILKHELIRRMLNRRSSRDVLFGFQSSFGRRFHTSRDLTKRECNWLQLPAFQMSMFDRNDFKHCVAPIDLTSDPTLFRESLENDYHMDLANINLINLPVTGDSKFGDLFMLKLKIKSMDWQSGCRLQIKTSYYQESKETVASLVNPNNESYSIAFRIRPDIRAHEQLFRILNSSEPLSVEDLEFLQMKILPSSFSLKIRHTDKLYATNITEMVEYPVDIKNITNEIKPEQKNSENAEVQVKDNIKCNMVLDYFVLEPIWTYVGKPPFSAMYINNVDPNRSVSILDAADFRKGDGISNLKVNMTKTYAMLDTIYIGDMKH